MSCHNIGHGLNEVVRKVLVEYDAGLIPYESVFRILQQCVKSVYWCDGNEYEATACMYDRCGRCLRKGLPMFRLGILYNDREVLELVKKEVIDYHCARTALTSWGSRRLSIAHGMWRNRPDMTIMAEFKKECLC